MTLPTHQIGDAPRRVLVVAGMHRSGTSTLTGILHKLGAALPKRMIPPGRGNPRGYFESEVLYPLHDELLADAGSAWDQQKGPSGTWFHSDAAARWVDRLAVEFENEFSGAGLLLFKDPRLCRVLPIWKRAFRQLDIETHYLIPVRHPLDVARSLQTANEVPIANGLLLWLDYFLRAEHDTRGCARSFLHFDQFTTDWQATIIQASASAGILLPEPDRATQADIDAFLQRDSDPATGLHDPSVDPLHPWIAEAYREALRGCGGEALDVDALDTLAAAFSLAEEAFGPAAATSEHRLQVERDRRQAVEHDVTVLDEKLKTRTQQRTALRERLTKRREEAQSLDEKLKTRTQQRTELRERLTKRREEAQSLRKTTELLMRWVLDQTRDTDRPASPELRAALAAIEKADPASIPQIASTAVLLADKNVQLKAYEREQTKLSALVASAESQVATAEQQLASTENLLSQSENEVAALNRDLDSLRTALRRAEEDLRIERVRSEDAAVEQARLTKLLSEQLQPRPSS